MKKQIASALVVFAFGFSATAATTPNLNGKYSVTDRICTDGSPAKDAFQMGRDKLEITFYDDNYQTYSVIQGQVSGEIGHFQILGRQLVTSSKGQETKLLFTLSANNELALVSAGFGPGGTCPQGEALMTVLQKQ